MTTLQGVSRWSLLLLAVASIWYQGSQLNDAGSQIVVVMDLQTNDSCNLVDADCLETTARQLSRVWKVKKLSSWCTPQDSSSPAPTLVLIKVPKSASSTAASLVLRLHHRHRCSCSWQHGTARELPLVSTKNNNNNATSNRFWLAPIRHPDSRAMSSVYFHQVSFHRRRRRPNMDHKLPSDSFIQDHLQNIPDNYITNYVRVDTTAAAAADEPLSLQTVASILKEYDFLLVVDRLEESVVVLTFLMNIALKDVLILSSKQSGSWYLSGNRCVQLVQPVYTESVRAFLNAKDWKRKHQYDRLLHAVANASLDQTIDQLIGRTVFESRLERYKAYQNQVETMCRNETYFPCSDTGTPQKEKSQTSCYTRDFGCGYGCIDGLSLQ